MRRLIVNMQSFIFSDALRRALRESGDFNVTAVDDPCQVVEQCRLLSANLLLMEVTGNKPWRLEERMKLRDSVKAQDPDCKVVLLVDEAAEQQAAKQVKQAKRDGLIDQFIYGSSSASFLVAQMETL